MPLFSAHLQLYNSLTYLTPSSWKVSIVGHLFAVVGSRLLDQHRSTSPRTRDQCGRLPILKHHWAIAHNTGQECRVIVIIMRWISYFKIQLSNRTQHSPRNILLLSLCGQYPILNYNWAIAHNTRQEIYYFIIMRSISYFKLQLSNHTQHSPRNIFYHYAVNILF